MKIIAIRTDQTAISLFRLFQPLQALSGHGVSFTICSYNPQEMGNTNTLPLCYEMLKDYDLCIMQRGWKPEVVQLYRLACDLAGIPLIYDIDDDYFNLPEHNRAHSIIIGSGEINKYPEVLSMFDGITTSTLELANLLYPFNKNIAVLPNNMLMCGCGEECRPMKDLALQKFDEAGKPIIPSKYGTVTIPGYVKEDGKFRRVVRVGYSATWSHNKDFDTILNSLEKVITRNGTKVCLVMIGDKAISDKLSKSRRRMLHIESTSNYWQYYDYLRNLDIGIAPLESNFFNLSKSPLKALEYGSWGIPAVLPAMVTYGREFTNNENCLMYYNSGQFEDALQTLIEDEDLRISLGTAARDRVRDNRLERLLKNVEPRISFYKKCIGMVKRQGVRA